MLFIVYGATLDLGYETREIFQKKDFPLSQNTIMCGMMLK